MWFFSPTYIYFLIPENLPVVFATTKNIQNEKKKELL